MRNHYMPLVTFKGLKVSEISPDTPLPPFTSLFGRKSSPRTPGPNPILLPLTTVQGTLLPIHFLSNAQVCYVALVEEEEE